MKRVFLLALTLCLLLAGCGAAPAPSSAPALVSELAPNRLNPVWGKPEPHGATPRPGGSLGPGRRPVYGLAGRPARLRGL